MKMTKFSTLFKKLVSIFTTAVILNFSWEMLQMPFFNEMSFTDWQDWLLCFKASISDAGLVLSILFIGRVLFKDWEWHQNLDILKLGYLILFGFVIAVYFEVDALNTARWSYSKLMPTLPLIGVGLVPVIQMLILPVLSFKIGLNILSFYKTRKSRI